MPLLLFDLCSLCILTFLERCNPFHSGSKCDTDTLALFWKHWKVSPLLLPLEGKKEKFLHNMIKNDRTTSHPENNPVGYLAESAEFMWHTCFYLLDLFFLLFVDVYEMGGEAVCGIPLVVR